MAEDPLVINRSFSWRIEQLHWKQRLDSHQKLITEFKQFLEPFHLSLFADRFIGIVRFRCFKVAGSKSSLEELQVDFEPPDRFTVKIAIRSSGEIIVEEDIFTLTDILAWQLSSEPLLTTKRIEIGLLLPSDEPEIIDFLKEPDVWKMRGEIYRPLENIHSMYQSNNNEVPWYKYHFVLRMCESKKPIGFISFYQISKPNLITPFISQTPYKPVMLSYALSKFYWGKGLMSESLEACVPWFVDSQTVGELVAFADINNRGSRRILQKLGLKECGVLENPKISVELKDMYNFIVYKS